MMLSTTEVYPAEKHVLLCISQVVARVLALNKHVSNSTQIDLLLP